MADSKPRRSTRSFLWTSWKSEKQRASDLLDRTKWFQAELENVQKRAAKDATAEAERQVARFVTSLLPALDSLEAAASKATADDGAGLRLVAAQFERALSDAGLTRIDAAGKPYDSALHDAAMREERPANEGEAPGLYVAEVLRTGYTFKGRVLRPAMVRVVEVTMQNDAESNSKDPQQEVS